MKIMEEMSKNNLKDTFKNTFGFIFLIIIIFLFYFIFKIISASDIDNSNLAENKVNSYNSLATSSAIQNVVEQNSQTNILQNNVPNNLENQNTNTNTNMNQNFNLAILNTSLGEIKIELASNKPKTVENFKKLISAKFYDGVKFHRVIKGFMIQTGDPLSKDESQINYWGTGGPGYKFNDELEGNEKYILGTVAMANSGPNTNGSQFFIMTSNTQLPPSYTVFGKVISGLDIALKIQDVAIGQNDRPLQAVTINSINLK